MRFPSDFDTSDWPDSLPVEETYHKTKRSLWTRHRAFYAPYLTCLDDLAVHCGKHSRNKIHRPLFHRLVAMHYGYDVDRLAAQAKGEAKAGPSCDPEHMAALTEAAHAVESQPDPRASAMWASEKVTLVLGLGWDRVRPEDIIGLTALGLLEEAVLDRPKFYKEILLPYAVKTKEQGGTKFSDDGTEQIDYVTELEAHLRRAAR